MHRGLKWLLYCLGFLVVGNIALLDYWIISSGALDKPQSLTTSTQSAPQKQINNPLQSCPQSCLSYIEEATASSATLQSGTGGTTAKASSQKELFVPIGSGTNASDDWEDVPGLQVVIDTAQYDKIKSSFFEAAVNVPSGNEIVYVRLYNVTDKHPVWYSELTFVNANTSQQLTSDKITLDSGNKAYKVQMKTQLKIPASLNSSRIRIITQ